MSFYEYGIYETVVRITLLISIFSLYGIPVLITRAKNLYSSKKNFFKYSFNCIYNKCYFNFNIHLYNIFFCKQLC